MGTIEYMEALKNIPKPALVLLVLTLAAILIMVSNPPKDACDAQLDVVAESQSGRLSSIRGKVSSLWVRSAKYCKESKTLGGCAEFHETVRLALKDIQAAPVECIARLAADESIKKILTDSLTLMVNLAWGERVPDLGNLVYGWMGSSELALFCDLKKNVKRNLLDEEWEIFVRRIISKLPHSSELSFEEAFGRSLFSVRCDVFM